MQKTWTNRSEVEIMNKTVSELVSRLYIQGEQADIWDNKPLSIEWFSDRGKANLYRIKYGSE